MHKTIQLTSSLSRLYSAFLYHERRQLFTMGELIVSDKGIILLEYVCYAIYGDGSDMTCICYAENVSDCAGISGR